MEKFPLSNLISGGVLRPQRFVAIDPGAYSIKLVWVESGKDGLRILDFREIQLSVEGEPLGPSEVADELAEQLASHPRQPIAFCLPQPLSLSQILDLPEVGDHRIREKVEEETSEIAGLSGSILVFDYQALKPFPEHPAPYWLTFSREAEVLAKMDELRLLQQGLLDVTSEANALLAAYAEEPGSESEAVLVNLGHSKTVVAIRYRDQGVYAGSFPVGMESIQALWRSSAEDPDLPMPSLQELLEAGAEKGSMRGFLMEWAEELRRIVQEWRHSLGGGLGRSRHIPPVILSGGGASWPGLTAHLSVWLDADCRVWPEVAERRGELSRSRFVMALGTATMAAGRGGFGTSLLPGYMRARHQEREKLVRLHSFNFVLLLTLALLLVFGTWRKFILMDRKEVVLEQTWQALESAKSTDNLAGRERLAAYQLQPLLFYRQQTLDTLLTLEHLQRREGRDDYFFVLFADETSYLSTPEPGMTNEAPNLEHATIQPHEPWRAFVLELCVPRDAEATRNLLSQLVVELKQTPLMNNVDALPDDRRKVLVDPQLLLPDRYFALRLELETNWFSEAMLPPPPEKETNSIPRANRWLGRNPSSRP